MNYQDFKKIYDKLPDLPGVYFFLAPKESSAGESSTSSKKEILYIGKATSLQDRLKSYFTDDLLLTRGPLVKQMIEKATAIDFQVTDSVLDALILENNLIKKYQPHANTREKDDKSYNHVIITREKFPQVLLMRGKNVGKTIHRHFIKYDFGPYPQGTQLREALKIVRRIFPFRDAKCVPAEEQMLKKKGKGVARACFSRQIGLCPGVCTGEISKQEYARVINHIRLFFEGKKSTLLKTLQREMATHARKQEFEKAGEIKRQLFALTHIQDVSLIKEDHKDAKYFDKSERKTIEGEKIFRVEAYDIAHMSGKNMTGAMIVLENGEFNKAEYRKFKIRTINHSNDAGALKEIIKRRFAHTEWPMPDLIVVDGNEVQKKAAEEALGELQIAVIAVVKNEKHQPNMLIGNSEIITRYQKEILLANNEAHRFVIAYHKRLRSNMFR